MSAVGLMTDTCVVYARNDTVVTGTNRVTRGYSATASGVPCAIQSAGPSETRQDGSDRGVFRVNIYVPIGTEVDANDYIGPTSGTYQGRFFTITSAPIDDAGRGEYLRFSAEQVEGFTKP